MIEEVDFDFAKCGHSLCIVDTKGSHSDLTDEYAAIRTEMESVAEFFGKKVLREVSEEEFKSKIRELRPAVGDRAILRAMHFYADNARVLKEVDALRGGDFETFKKYILESGASSYKYNQNVFSVKQPSVQPVSLALAVSESILKGRGAWRVHGGGLPAQFRLRSERPFKGLQEHNGEHFRRGNLLCALHSPGRRHRNLIFAASPKRLPCKG